ncbi:StlD/DarB family beta-ketosynthase [Desulfopila sp. IMCC35006]|uniref:beta-ketoacyl-ACP synthase III n=1 Tax=Desulfopila sp. IMCC35006 TaxID=2569542 RepID=UPI0010ABCDCE|nr:beta-ketoacyl-ACP synthase III [Desulfopila sp. IMCC35006]TKB28270.1 StlD/DarB family beta-ketosynthase [Desulfopila sp. IMCC35006]
MNAFITAVSSVLPGEPVDNRALDDYLGAVSNISAKTRQIILGNNGIKTRYYAMDPQTGRITYTNAQLAAEAVRRLRPGDDQLALWLECLCCGTSSPDQLMPGHGSMVHGELAGAGPCEVISTAGICLSGITAMKFGALSVAQGMTANAVTTGSELACTFLRGDFFAAMSGSSKNKEFEKNQTKRHPAFSFEADFLRWMLSDGAGAVLIEDKPAAGRPSLRIDWIEIISHAHQLEACMYAGAVKQKDGSLTGWREYARNGGLEKQGIMTIKQDARLLNREIIRATIGESLPRLVVKHSLKPSGVDWFLPHYSSEYFKEPVMNGLAEIGFPIPEDRWFSNLSSKGNTGSASFYIMLEELFSSGRLKKGDRILGMIPESGRFAVGWVSLTVV